MEELLAQKTNAGKAPPVRTVRSATPSRAAEPVVAAEPAVATPPPEPSSDAPAPAHNDTTQASSASGATDVAPQELLVLRENSVSLKPNRGEVSTELSYTNRKTPFQSDRAFIANTSIRYGIVDWLELGATIPAGFSSRKTATGPDTSVVHDVTGFGDATIQLNARLLEQTAVLPGVVLSVGGILPTGPSPYRFERYQFNGPFGVATPNPNDSLTDFFSRNAWGTRGNLELFKTTDPLILFIGVSIDYLLSQRYNSFVVQSGLRFGYNMGFSFALSDRTTLGFTINGSYSDSLTVNGRTVANSSSEPILARLSLIQHVFTNTFLEPSIAFGLTADAPDVILSLGIRERF